MAKNVFCEVTLTLTFDHQNLSTSFSSPRGCLYQVWRKPLQVFLRYHVHKKRGGHVYYKKFPEGHLEIWCSHEWDGLKTQCKHGAIKQMLWIKSCGSQRSFGIQSRKCTKEIRLIGPVVCEITCGWVQGLLITRTQKHDPLQTPA